MTGVRASNRPRRGCTTRRLVAAWIAGAFLLLGLPVTASAATAPAAAPQVHRQSGIGDAPGVRVDRPATQRLVRQAEPLRLLDTHPAVVPTSPAVWAPSYLGLALAAPDTSAHSVPAAVARGRGPPVPAIPSAGPYAFLGRPDVSGALSDSTA